MNMNVVNMENVTFSYDKNPVLKDVNLKINPGDFIAIVGPNGAAKSTLIKLMVGLLKPNKGKIELFGENIRTFNKWHKIGYMPQQAQDVNISFPATVKEVVASGYYNGFGKIFDGEKHHQVAKALEIVGISDLSKRLIRELSGGQRQKMFLAKTLVKSPDVVFLDEPTAGIDVGSQGEFYRLLQRLNERGITIIMVTHDLKAVFHMVKKVICIHNQRAHFYDDMGKSEREHILKTLGYRVSE